MVMAFQFLVHLASAIAAAMALVTGLPQHLSNPIPGTPLKLRVFSDTTRAVLYDEVYASHEDGENFAEAPGYMVGGKTGTAEKSKLAVITKRPMSQLLPRHFVHDPRHVIIAMIDELKGQKHSYGYATAGWAAAPPIRPIATNCSSTWHSSC